MLRLSFRATLMTIFGSTALAFLILLIVSAVTTRRVEQTVTSIEDRYLPRVELAPKLDAQFALLQRSLRDAVIAGDADALEQTREIKKTLLGQLDAARELVDPDDAAALRVAIEDYYATAYEVSRRMLAGETGEPIVDVMASMQIKQTRATELLRRTTALDRRELTKTFAEARMAQDYGTRVRFVVTAAALSLVLALSLLLSRAPLRAVAELGAGFERFGKGQFEREIHVSSGGELAVVAEHANRMAASLDRHARELVLQRQSLEEKNRELDEARQHLEQKARELTTVSTYKSQFLANMSHELRTPLNSMLLLSYLLAENEAGHLTPKQVEFARTIHGAGKDLLALINQVLDLAKVEAGKEELHVEAVSIRDLGDYAESFFGALARHKGLRFVVEIGAGLPETIATDRQRLVQILNNLLTNAIKFTDQGEVTLRIQSPESALHPLRGDLPLDQAVAFAVSDSGVGIAAEHQERVFAPFEQVEAGSDRKYGGTGLGLTIARQLAALLGGELQLESAAGKGSTFALYLPRTWQAAVNDASKAALAPIPAPSDSGGEIAKLSKLDDDAPAGPDVRLQGRRVLFVDDDMRTLYSLSAALSAKGLEVEVADTGRAALRVLEEHPNIEVVLMDIMMPELDGYETIQRIRNDPRFAKLPIIALTANAMVGDREKCLAAGATDYLAKPIPMARLLVMLHTCLSERPTGERGAQSTS